MRVEPVLFDISASCPLTVAELNPVKVYPPFAVSVTEAVYTVPPRNGLWDGDHDTWPMVKLLPLSVLLFAVAVGVAPFTGAVMEMLKLIFAVTGNTAVTIPEFAALLTDVAPVTVKKLAATPCRVCRKSHFS